MPWLMSIWVPLAFVLTTLVTSYSYQGEVGESHVEVVRWKLPQDVKSLATQQICG